MTVAWTPEKRQKAIDLYLSGKTLVECCAILLAGSLTIQKYLREAGVKLRPAAKRPWSPEKVARCVQLYIEGYSQDEVARLVGCAQWMVCKVLGEQGVESRHRWHQERKDRLAEMYLGGATMAQCCHAMQTNKKTIKLHLRKMRIAIRPYEPHRGADCGAWKGGRQVDEDGYIHIRLPFGHPDYPGYMPEHRMKMEEYLGRRLTRSEVVHHKNKDKHDNRIENLQLFASNAEHLAFELKGQCPKWSAEGRRRTREAHERWCEQQRKRNRSKSGDRR